MTRIQGGGESARTWAEDAEAGSWQVRKGALGVAHDDVESVERTVGHPVTAGEEGFHTSYPESSSVYLVRLEQETKTRMEGGVGEPVDGR